MFSDLLLHFSGELKVSCRAERSSLCGRPSKGLRTFTTDCLGRSKALLLNKKTRNSTGRETSRYIKSDRSLTTRGLRLLTDRFMSIPGFHAYVVRMLYLHRKQHYCRNGPHTPRGIQLHSVQKVHRAYEFEMAHDRPCELARAAPGFLRGCWGDLMWANHSR